MILVDKYYYGRWVVPSLQIVLYNVLGGEGRGPELYGVEPVSYYLVNGFLNFTLAFPLALIVAPTIVLFDPFFENFLKQSPLAVSCWRRLCVDSGHSFGRTAAWSLVNCSSR